jgi:hypothetical protein
MTIQAHPGNASVHRIPGYITHHIVQGPEPYTALHRPGSMANHDFPATACSPSAGRGTGRSRLLRWSGSLTGTSGRAKGPDSRHLLTPMSAHHRSMRHRTPDIRSKTCLATTPRSRTRAGGTGGIPARSKPASPELPPFQLPERRCPDRLPWRGVAAQIGETPRAGTSHRRYSRRAGTDWGGSQYRLSSRGSQQPRASWRGLYIGRSTATYARPRSAGRAHPVRPTGWACWQAGCSG